MLLLDMVGLGDTLAQAELTALGLRLRTLRTEQEWTLEETARRTGLSKSYLSRLEDGERQPSIAALLALAQAHGMPLAALFGPPQAKSSYSVVRAGELNEQQGNGLRYALLAQPGRAASMHPIHVVVPAERSGDDLYQHDGEEWLYVLSGILRLTLAGETLLLYPGDAAHFDAHAPHRLAAEGVQDAEVILVACAAPKTLLDSYL